MPLCMSLQYPLQNRAKVQKIIEIYKKKSTKFPIFQELYLSIVLLISPNLPAAEQRGMAVPET